MKIHSSHAGLLLILWSSLAIMSCSKESGTDNGNNNNNTNPGTSVNNISINDMKFGSGSLSVKAGTTVTWTNNENMVHTVTADDGSFSSGDIKYTETYSRTFSTAGTYNYHCQYHPQMKAAVSVN